MSSPQAHTITHPTTLLLLLPISRTKVKGDREKNFRLFRLKIRALRARFHGSTNRKIVADVWPRGYPTLSQMMLQAGAEPRCARAAHMPIDAGHCADRSEARGATPSPDRERDQTPSVPPRVLLDDLQFEEEGESPMGDVPSVTYSPPNTRRAQSAGGSSSTSAGDIPAALVQPPPSAAAAAAAAAGDDCGECTNCRDKPKFGGPGTKRKGCLVRRDTKPLRPSGLSVSAVGTPPVASMLANKSPRREAPFTGGSADSVSVSQTPDADDSDALASDALAEPSSDPSDDCGVCVTCLDKRKFGGRGIKRKGCLRKKEVTDAMRGVAHPSHSVHADQEDEAPAPRSTQQPRDTACETPATVDALAGQPSSGAASEEPRAYEKRLRLRAEARGAGKRAASGLSTGSYSAGAASSSAAKSDDDESEADEAPDKAYEAGTDGTPDAPPGDDYDAVHLIGEGLTDSPRAPLNELSVNRSVPAPATPQLKTPDLEVAAGGVSPLSEFANILEVTPNLRLPEQARPTRPRTPLSKPPGTPKAVDHLAAVPLQHPCSTLAAPAPPG